jgi:hypothetical protein
LLKTVEIYLEDAFLFRKTHAFLLQGLSWAMSHVKNIAKKLRKENYLMVGAEESSKVDA